MLFVMQNKHLLDANTEDQVTETSGSKQGLEYFSLWKVCGQVKRQSAKMNLGKEKFFFLIIENKSHP